MSQFIIRNVPSGIKFDLRTADNQVVATSEVYTTMAACKTGIESVRKNAPIAKMEDRSEEGFVSVTNPKFEMYLDKAGEYRFRLKARNGEIIAVSDGYKTRESCEMGIEYIRRNTPAAEIREEKC